MDGTETAYKYRTLTLDEATKALKLERNYTALQSWLQSSDREVLLNAILRNKDEVYLPILDLTFSISQDVRPNSGLVWVMPIYEPRFPCGWFDPMRIAKEIEIDQNVSRI